MERNLVSRGGEWLPPLNERLLDEADIGFVVHTLILYFC